MERKMNGRIIFLIALMAVATGVAAADKKATKTLKPLPAVFSTVMEDGTTNYFANGDFTQSFTNWQLHGTTNTVVTLTGKNLPPGGKGQALRYLKTDAVPEADYHVNHPIRVPGAGKYILSYWCKTTAPLVPMVFVRYNRYPTDLEPAKLFPIKNEGAWQHYENEFEIPSSWPTTFVIELLPGTKGLNKTGAALGTGFTGETLFATFAAE